MSTHFTYEMDEKKIRTQLQQHTLEPTEEDWIKFNQYQLSENSNTSRKKFNTVLNLTLNRNVLMPLVFGIMILAFASLLFNFVTIKSSSAHESEAASINNINNSNTETVETPQVIQQKKVSLPIPDSKPTEKDLKTLEQTPTKLIGESQTNLNSAKAEITNTPIPSSEKKQFNETISSKPDSQEKTAALSPEISKKKDKQSVSKPVNAEKILELKPVIITEEQESEERPEEIP